LRSVLSGAGSVSAPREVKNHARRLERWLAIERDKRLEPGPYQWPAVRAGRPTRDGLVEERFDEAHGG